MSENGKPSNCQKLLQRYKKAGTKLLTASRRNELVRITFDEFFSSPESSCPIGASVKVRGGAYSARLRSRMAAQQAEKIARPKEYAHQESVVHEATRAAGPILRRRSVIVSYTAASGPSRFMRLDGESPLA